MVLVTNHTQSPCAAVSSRTLPWSKGIRLKQNVIRFQITSQVDRRLFQKQTSPLRPAARYIHDAKGKPLQISSFKSNVHNDEARNGSSKSVSPKNSVKISFVQHDTEETLTQSAAAEDAEVSNAPESNKAKSGSLDVRGLFRSWLNVLCTDVPHHAVDNILEGPPQMDNVQEPKKSSTTEKSGILKVVFCYFLGLDATIAVPLLIFIPLYLGVNVVYGAEVSRELTPLWIIGPLMVALYVKLLRGIIALYAFSFKQTVKVIKNLPTYSSITYKYIAEGKLKQDIRARFWQPVIDIKNMDYKELALRKWKAFQEWITEKYLDFVESIWPYYCRTIRFLKRANLI